MRDRLVQLARWLLSGADIRLVVAALLLILMLAGVLLARQIVLI